MKQLLLCVGMMLSIVVIMDAQKEDHQWLYHWGSVDTIDYPGWSASVLDFNSLPPIAYRKSEILIYMRESHASICDENGQLLYYSNAQTIYGPEHEPIINGDTINYGPVWDSFTSTNSNGVTVTSGFRGAQQVGFIPQPESDTTLVVYQDKNKYFESNENDMTLLMSKITQDDFGQSRVVEKDVVLNENIRVTGKLTACKHANGRDWWLLQFSKNQVYTYLIDPQGIHLYKIQTVPFQLYDSNVGQAKFSEQGNKFGMMGKSWNKPSETNLEIMVSDFDRCDGSILNPKLLRVSGLNNLLSNGLSFSPNGNLLYYSSNLSIQQIDLTADDLEDSIEIIAEHNGINNCSIDNGPNPKSFGQMQLGPDNKIYISLAAQCNDVHVIHSPNVRGVECNMEQNAIILPTFVKGTIPTLNTYRLGPLDGSACDTLGIDNNPVSRFWYEQDSLDFLTVDFWDVSYFRPEDWAWDFGDGRSSTAQHPEHSYEKQGAYDVCLTVSNENSSHTSCQTLYLGVSSAKDITEKVSVSLFPNPTEDKFRIVIKDYLPEHGRLSLYDLTGKSLLSSKVRSGATIIDISAISPGTYIYELRDGGKLLDSGKVVRI